MTIHRNTLLNLEFVPTHQLLMDGDLPVFRIHPSAAIRHDDRPAVYMWLSPLMEIAEFDVLYIGKAGYGVDRRISQHQGGFTHSGTGRDNRRLITELLRAGRSIEVYRRVSSVHQLFGQEISLYSAEEQALCERYSPLWNRARFPQVYRADPALSVESLQSSSEDAVSAPLGVDFSQVIQADEISTFLDSLDMHKRTQFLSLCKLLQRIEPGARQKLVAGYSGQPKGYDGKPVFVFGHIGNDGRARRRVGWIALTDSETAPLAVIFPAKARRSG